MPRRNRQIEDDRCYHIVTRGNDRRKIFRSPRDYECFIALAAESKSAYPIRIYHYCVMGNHLHLLVRAISKASFPKFFQVLFQGYAHYYRTHYRHTGHLYQNRYKSIPIENDGHLLDCARYIERNPLRAGIVEAISDYPWSSYHYYASGTPDPLIDEPDPASMALASSAEERRRLYREYLIANRPYEHIVDKEIGIE